MQSSRAGLFQWAAGLPRFTSRGITTFGNPVESVSQDYSSSVSDLAPRVKFKRLDKTAKNIMQILDKEDVEEVRMKREIPDIKPGYIVQVKVEVPENKQHVSILKGIVIVRRNAGLNTTFRIRRLVVSLPTVCILEFLNLHLTCCFKLEKKLLMAWQKQSDTTQLSL
nr:uncharacterized protein LOC112012282 [Quercus suber]XP_023900434.1 uncharacterized protein LOC112012282 [Quercus suber]XP_023900435.1 uncharacterized protein LOC112012282 [Quercus suber]XP_023900436.1 uncharacterized protein LOC112012282 [Quercus suber]XP_023900437.1 uncharacterized protein LOC112012282 [Quercus suber]POE50772.1 50s ribosomal protein l19, chloroplastic [Quercus suber]